MSRREIKSYKLDDLLGGVGGVWRNPAPSMSRVT